MDSDAIGNGQNRSRERAGGFAWLMALTLVFVLALAGCGGDKKVDGGGSGDGAGSSTEGALADGSGADVDIYELADALKEGISFNYDMAEISQEEFFAMYGLEESSVDMANFAVYASPWAEDIAVFEAVDESKSTALEKVARSRVDSQKKEFEDYDNPMFDTEVALAMKQLDDAVLVKKGKYVVLVVSSDSAGAERIIGDYLK